MNGISETYLFFLCGLGWIVVAWTAIGEVLGWRAAAVLIAFGFLCGAGEGVNCVLALNGVDPLSGGSVRLQALAGVAEGGLLLEFIRRFRHESTAAKLPAFWHIATLLVLAAAVVAPPGWCWPIAGIFSATVAAGATTVLWHARAASDPRRAGLRFAAVGLALWAASSLIEPLFVVRSPTGPVYAAVLLIRTVAPWLWCVGISETNLAAAGVRRRKGWIPFALLATTPFILPVIDRQVTPRLAALPTPHLATPVMEQRARHTLEAAMGMAAVFLVVAQGIIWRRAVEEHRRISLRNSETASRSKTEFLAFLGHELRTPLQTILGRAEMLLPEPAAHRHAAAIEAQGRLLLRLVNDLLDLGTIEAGHFTLRPQPFSLRATLAHLDDLVRPLAAAKSLALQFNVAADAPDGLLGDEPRLRQILGNLLANSVKFTSDGEVRLDVTFSGPTPSRFTFRVSDTGPGLPVEQIPRLFTLFTRLDAGGTFTREGTGVGLALVKLLCDLMGGSVTAVNRPGGGAEFTVRLLFPEAPVPLPAAIPGPASPIAPLQVLIVEDNSAARELLAESLRQSGHAVTTAVDGPAALAACSRQAFDAVVLDINLPGIDGIEVARRLRTQPRCPRLIGCSAEVMSETHQAALQAGMDVFLEKPVALAQLAAVLAGPGGSAGLLAGNAFESVRAVSPSAAVRGVILAEIPSLRLQLASAHAASDAAALRRHAHYLHTSALLLDAPGLVALCIQLGREATAGDLPAATTTLASLDATLDRITT